ncbi:MAG: radical SAM protein [Archangium sp.]|nr:radical SAM protein [Archangium sp.]
MIDVALISPPPYGAQPWLTMGVVLHATLLRNAGIDVEVLRLLNPPFAVPEPVQHASLVTFTFDPTMDERLELMERADAASPGFFDALVDAALKLSPRIVGLSVFRNNVDVALHLARRIKARSPSTRVIIGGPEAIEAPRELLLPFVDVVLGAEAENVFPLVVRALLAAEPVSFRNVFTHAGTGDTTARVPEFPQLDYARVLPLLVGDQQPTVPMLLNWGCPYSCSYCSNRVTYSRFTEGSVERVLAEMDAIVSQWAQLGGGGLSLQLSDATTNALPSQLDALLRGIIERRAKWPLQPKIRGQMLFDARLTEERVALLAEAGFGNTFFGVDGAGAALRKGLHRPGSLEQVEAAARLWLERGLSGLTFGFPVGIPGETDEDFEAALQFVERILALGRSEQIESITVLPYVFFRSAQDAAFTRLNTGAPRGVMWRASVPGGDPAVRARRFMTFFERIAGRVETVSPIPPYLLLPAMLPDEPQRVSAFLERFGRSFDQLTPPARHGGAAVVEVDSPTHRALRGVSVDAWRFESFGQRAGVVIAIFAAGDSRVAVEVAPPDKSQRAFVHSAAGNVSYLQQWNGKACVFDERVVRACVAALEAK